MAYPGSYRNNKTHTSIIKKTIILFILIFSACNPSNATVITTPSLSPSATPSFTTTPKLPSPTPTPRPVCPKFNNPNIPVVPEEVNYLWVKQTINDYLAEGGDPEQLISALSMPEYGNLNIEFDKVDINDDGVNELIFSSGIFLPAAGRLDGVDSGLWVFQCENGNYVIPYDIELLGGYEGNPRLIAAVDLNNDNRKEIIIRYTWNGSGCLRNFKIVSWKKENPKTILLFSDQYFPCETEFAIGNKDSNGNNYILFTGKSDFRYDSVAYIQREFIDTYELSNDVYTFVSHEYIPSPYRVYAIYDAQKALDNGDTDLAIQLYNQAAYDETLQDIDSLLFRYVDKWPQDLPTQDNPKEYISSFSLFRLIISHFETNNEPKVVSTLQELETNYPEGKPGSEFTKAAELYIQQRKEGNNPFESCQAVSNMIELEYPYLDWHFNWSTWTVFEYTNETICPYLSE